MLASTFKVQRTNVNVVMQSSAWPSVVLAGIWAVLHKDLRVGSISTHFLDLTMGVNSGLDKNQPYPLERCQARRKYQDDGPVWQVHQEVCCTTLCTGGR